MPGSIENPFKSFWMAGYECTDQLNVHGDRVDFLHVTGHLDAIDMDYKLLGKFGIKTVREGVRWSRVEVSPYRYNFQTLGRMLRSGKENGIQQIWDICHFGFPDDLTPLHPKFPDRFAALCEAFLKFYKSFGFAEPLIVTPINEVSFISWLGGEVAATSPFCRRNGWEVKYALMQAYIKGIEAFKQIDPDTRILTTEPLVNITPPTEATMEQILDAAQVHELQFQSLDMLSGVICPELGGKPEYLDILGFNYYCSNQWVHSPYERLDWKEAGFDAQYKPLSELLQEAFDRYDRPFALTETSHYGAERPDWLRHVSDEVSKLISRNYPLWGVCLYPVLDRPDWDNLDDWHHSGLWDEPGRTLHLPSAVELAGRQLEIGAALIRNTNRTEYNPDRTAPVTSADNDIAAQYPSKYLSRKE